jgi:hypothetical protein
LVEWRSQVTEGDRAEVLGLVSGQDQTQVIDASWGYRQAGRSYYRRGNLAVDVATEDEGHLLLNWVDVDPPRRRGYVYTELRTNVASPATAGIATFRRIQRRSWFSLSGSFVTAAATARHEVKSPRMHARSACLKRNSTGLSKPSDR